MKCATSPRRSGTARNNGRVFRNSSEMNTSASLHNAFPGHHAASLQSGDLSAYAVQNSQRLHFVLFYDGDFAGTSSSGGSNRKTNTWTDEGAIRLKNGRSFGFRRAIHPEMLTVNGTEYDLREGTLLTLQDDGVLRHMPLFPEPIARENLPALAEKIAQNKAAPAVKLREIGFDDPAIGQRHVFTPIPGVNWISTFDASGGLRALAGTARVAQIWKSWVDVAYPADPQNYAKLASKGHPEMGPVDAAFKAWEKSVAQWMTRRLERSEIKRITQFGPHAPLRR